MKKIAATVLSSVIAVGGVLIPASMRYTPDYNSVPITITGVWRVDQYLPPENSPFQEVNTKALYLDIEITNIGDKPISNIRAGYDCNMIFYNKAMGQMIPSLQQFSMGMNLLRDEDVIEIWGGGDWAPAVVLNSGETRRVSVLVKTHQMDEAIYIKTTDLNLYITWINFAGLLGGQWGNPFGINRSILYDSEFDFTAVAFKFEMPTFHYEPSASEQNQGGTP